MDILVTRESRIIKIVQALIIFLIASFNSNVNASTDEWKIISSDQGMQLFEKQHTKGSLVPLKAEMILPFSIEEVACVLTDTSRKKQWAPSLVKNSILKEPSIYERIEYLIVDFPWPLLDRDFLFHVEVNVSDDSKEINIIARSIIDDTLAPETHLVRGFIHESSMVLTDENEQTKLSITTYTDPKGKLPKWVVNLFTRILAPSTLNRFRHQVELNLYGEHEINRIKDLVQGYHDYKSLQINHKKLQAHKYYFAN